MNNGKSRVEGSGGEYEGKEGEFSVVVKGKKEEQA